MGVFSIVDIYRAPEPLRGSNTVKFSNIQYLFDSRTIGELGYSTTPSDLRGSRGCTLEIESCRNDPMTINDSIQSRCMFDLLLYPSHRIVDSSTIEWFGGRLYIFLVSGRQCATCETAIVAAHLNSDQLRRVMTARGFNELVGVKLERADFVSRALTDMIRQSGYEQISIPIIEKASSFLEDVVGEANLSIETLEAILKALNVKSSKKYCHSSTT